MSKTNPKVSPSWSPAVDFEDYRAPTRMIERDAYFDIRAAEIDKVHVHALAQRIREIGALDPVLLWQGKGGFVILDGAHRIEAYKKAGWTDPVPSRIAHCDRRAALLLAIQANSKVTLTLSNSERWNLAWKLVRHPEVKGDHAFTKTQITNSTAVAKGTVDNMRRRLKEMQQGGREPTGNWMSDRRGDADADWDGPDEAAREAMIEEKARALRKVFNVRGTRDDEALSEALQRAAGDHRLRHWFELLYGDHYDDDEGDDEEANLGF